MSDTDWLKAMSRELGLPDYLSNMDGPWQAVWGEIEDYPRLRFEDVFFEVYRSSEEFFQLENTYKVTVCIGINSEDDIDLSSDLSPPSKNQVFFKSDLMSKTELMKWFQKNLETIRKVLDAA